MHFVLIAPQVSRLDDILRRRVVPVMTLILHHSGWFQSSEQLAGWDLPSLELVDAGFSVCFPSMSQTESTDGAYWWFLKGLFGGQKSIETGDIEAK